MKTRSSRSLLRGAVAARTCVPLLTALAALGLGGVSRAVHARDPGSGPGSCDPITVSPARLARAVHCLDYSAELSASGGIAPYVFTVSAGALPAGLALAPEGVLAGVPSVAGAAAFTVTATDADGCTGDASFLFPVARGFRATDDQVELLVPPAGSGGTGDPLLDRTTSTLEVSGILDIGVAVVAADVYVALRHERTGDLLLSLVAPDGTRTRLATQRGGTGQDLAGTCFSAGADDGICAGSAPFAGTYRPEEPTHLLRPNGAWTLEIEDTADGATGELLDWSLALDTAGAGQRYPGRKFAWWGFPSAPPTNLSASATDLYLSTEAGAVIRWSKLGPFGAWVRNLPGAAVRSLYVERSFGTPVVAVASESGWAYALDDANGDTVWSRDLRRVFCAADALTVPPVVQLWSRSDCAFRQAVPDDLVFFATDFACTGTSANKVIALDGGSGAIRWTFNTTGSTVVERITGMLVDPTRNRLYVVTAKDPLSVRNTAFALDTRTGARLWANDVGDIAVPPVLGDGLFVLSRNGALAELDPDTGLERWTLTLAGGMPTFTSPIAHDPSEELLFAVDSANDLHAIADLGDSAALVWSWAPATETLGHVVVLPHREWVLVSAASSGSAKIHQIDKLTGTPASFAQVPSSTGIPRLQLDEGLGGSRVESRIMALSQNLVTRAYSIWQASDSNFDDAGEYQALPAVALALGGTTAPPAVPIGGIVTDELVLTNLDLPLSLGATRGAECLTLTTTLPPGTTLVSVEAAQGTHALAGQVLTIRLGRLEIGHSLSVRVRLRPPLAGDFARTYTAAAHLPYPDTLGLTNRVWKVRRSP